MSRADPMPWPHGVGDHTNDGPRGELGIGDDELARLWTDRLIG